MDDFYIDKVLNGDQEAFRYLIQRYKNMCYTISMSVVKDEFAAQEIVQDAFVKAYQNLASFNKTSSFGTWIYRIVTNESLMYLRKNKPTVTYFDASDYSEIADETVYPFFSQDERSHTINNALQQLAPNESLALRLFYLREENIKMVCLITGWTEANTKVILHRARKNMHALLTKMKKENL